MQKRTSNLAPGCPFLCSMKVCTTGLWDRSGRWSHKSSS